MSKRLKIALDALWLLALCAYILAGVPVASFHGDEAMQIHMSRDFDTAFLQGKPQDLMTHPPYPIDSDGHLRILNGTINRHTIGLSWYLAGMRVDELPPPPGWDWGLDYQRGIETGHRPNERLMLAARLPSALFLCGSALVMFGLGWIVGGRQGAYLASGLYALNPVILLNGRRAMQEGSMLFFGLLTVYAAAFISGRRAMGKPDGIGAWLGFIVGAALTLASKHSGIVFAAGAGLWLLAAELAGRRRFGGLLARLVVSAALVVAGFVALSPALWNDPLARFSDLLAVRAELLNIQVAIDPIAPTTLAQRVADIVTQPFIAPAAHYELPSWGEDALFMSEVARSAASPFSGIQYGLVVGVPLTLLALLGVVVAARQMRDKPIYAGLLAWLVVTAASLLVNPLPWQRYFLPLIPAVTLFAAVGIGEAVEWLRRSLFQAAESERIEQRG